jgi:hypothetical protein
LETFPIKVCRALAGCVGDAAGAVRTEAGYRADLTASLQNVVRVPVATRLELCCVSGRIRINLVLYNNCSVYSKSQTLGWLSLLGTERREIGPCSRVMPSRQFG